MEQPSDRGQAFEPVQGGDTTSGEVLLIEAYAAMWLVALVLVLMSWSRQKGIEQRIASLRGAIDKVRADVERAPQPAKSESGGSAAAGDD